VTTAPSLALGGRYRLVERLAVGGMGEVWCAEDLVLGRSVAVKVLREEHAGDPTFRRRFREEAQHAAMLVHPNIAQVFDFGEGDEGPADQGGGEPPYLVMELIRGEPLSAVLEREGPLDAEQTWSILGQTASALSAAHAAGIVHRDIKPANILLCPDGGLKVTDFGIARAAGASAVTTAGTLLGTPHYISPEQVTGDTVTAASDFYSLGVVAYECLTGSRLYDGDAMAVMLAHRNEPPQSLPDGIPAGLRDLVMALLDKDPDNRPTDGRAIAAQADRFNSPTVAVPVLADPYPPETPRPLASTGPATGVLDRPSPAARRFGGRTAVIATVAVLVVAALVAAVLIATSRGGHDNNKATTAPKSTPLVHVAVASVEPYAGDGGSVGHPEEAPLAVDGQASTAWYTQHYASAAFGQLRSGAGLLFDLGHPVAVKSLKLRLAVTGVALQVHAGDAVGSLLSSSAVGSSASAPSVLTLRPTTTARYWLVWFTKLAPNDGAYRAGVAEATFAR
jgi:serine/threonine-protein kinase